MVVFLCIISSIDDKLSKNQGRMTIMPDDKIPNRPIKPEISPPEPTKRPVFPGKPVENEPDTIPNAEPIINHD